MSGLPLIPLRTKVVKRHQPRNLFVEEVGKTKKINEDLQDIPEFLLIGKDKKLIGKKTYREAIDLARMNKLELVLVKEDSNPPVARLMDSKDPTFLEYVSRTQEGIREKIKEMRFSEVISEHDTQIKVNKLRNLLQSGYRVRVSVQFKHRENFEAQSARAAINNVVERVGDIAVRDSKTGVKFFGGNSAYCLLIPKVDKIERTKTSSSEQTTTQITNDTSQIIASKDQLNEQQTMRTESEKSQNRKEIEKGTEVTSKKEKSNTIKYEEKRRKQKMKALEEEEEEEIDEDEFETIDEDFEDDTDEFLQKSALRYKSKTMDKNKPGPKTETISSERSKYARDKNIELDENTKRRKS